MSNESYYDILGVTYKATSDEITAAKNKLAKMYHPDVNMRKGIDTTEKMQEILEAYSVLSDKEKRAEYDREIRGTTSVMQTFDLSKTEDASDDMRKYAEQGMTVEMRGVDFGYVDDKQVLRKSDFVAINAISRSIPSAAKDNEPSNTSFVRRTFFNQHTGADCPNCPFMTYLIKRTLNDEVKDKVVLASVRNYAGEVDFANVPNPVSSWPYLHIDYDTTYPYNGTVDGLQSKIDEWTSAPAKVGISANPMYYEDGQIIVKVSVKAAETDEYNVGLWLMQDNIYIKQQVASDRLHLLDGTWGDEYHYHNNCVRIAESRYLGSHVGYPLGKIEAGKTAEWIFLINANIGQKDLNGDGRCDVGDSWWYTKGKINLDDLHFAAFVTTHKGTVYKVANVIDFKYNETKLFEYIK